VHRLYDLRKTNGDDSSIVTRRQPAKMFGCRRCANGQINGYPEENI